MKLVAWLRKPWVTDNWTRCALWLFVGSSLLNLITVVEWLR